MNDNDDDCCPEERAKKIGEQIRIPHKPKTSFNLYEDMHGHRALKHSAWDKWDCLDPGIRAQCGETMTLIHSADIDSEFVDSVKLTEIFKILKFDIDAKRLPNQNQNVI